MKRMIAAGSIAMLALVGCSSNDEPTPTKTVFVQPSAEAPTFDAQEPLDQAEVFLNAVRSEVGSAQGISDADLVEFGQNICTAISNGQSIESIASLGLQNNVAPHDIGFLIGASVGAFCPEHTQKIEDFAERHGGNDVLTG